MIKSAIISEDGKYRYRLNRTWDESLPVLGWVMLNPSTADAASDDPTIRKCIGFAKKLNYGGIEVCNLFALRSTDCRVLRNGSIGSVIGDKNDNYIRGMGHARIVMAWGDGKSSLELEYRIKYRAEDVLGIIRNRAYCLGITQKGNPRHPLMLGYNTPIEPMTRRMWA